MSPDDISGAGASGERREASRGRSRRALVLEALGAGEGDVEALARRFGVSASTVRRDLQQLSSAKAVRRTYGGAILAEPRAETSLDQRLAINGPEKRAIARAALGLVEDGETLILDAGSTVAAFAQLLVGRRLRVITNNLAIVPVLAGAPEIDVVVLGGNLRPTSMGTVGPLAIEALRRWTASRALMGADGVLADRGLCEASLDQVALKSAMMAQARETVVLADASKLGRSEPSVWAPLPACWTLVTDTGASAEQRHALEAAGARVITAGHAEGRDARPPRGRGTSDERTTDERSRGARSERWGAAEEDIR